MVEDVWTAGGHALTVVPARHLAAARPAVGKAWADVDEILGVVLLDGRRRTLKPSVTTDEIIIIIDSDICVTSHRALRHVPLDFQLFIIYGHFRAAQHNMYATLFGCLPRNNIQAYSSDMVYCINFMTFLCVTLKLSSLSFVFLLAPNPGYATGQRRSVGYRHPGRSAILPAQKVVR